MQNSDLFLTLLILATCGISAVGFSNRLFFQRYQFHVGAILRAKQYERLITSGFLHADWTHLLFNMLTLYFFHEIILVLYGPIWFFALYFGALLASNLFSLLLYRNRPSYAAIGASGAVSGILFASIAIAPEMMIRFLFIPIDIPAWLFATGYFAYSVYMMLNPRPHDNIGHAAHLGGAVFGFAFVIAMTPQLLSANGLYIGIMSLPLLYMGFELFLNKKRR